MLTDIASTGEMLSYNRVAVVAFPCYCRMAERGVGNKKASLDEAG